MGGVGSAMTESGLFAAPYRPSPAGLRGSTVEQRLDNLAELAKEATQLAGRVRTNLDSVAKGAAAGSVGNAEAQIRKISEAIAQLSVNAEALAEAEGSLGLRGEQASLTEFERELESELI